MKTALRILHITCSRDDVRNVKKAFQKAGLTTEVLQAETAEACAEAIRRGTWDAVLADYEVPGFKVPAGLALVTSSGLDLPYIILSDPVGEIAVASGFKAGASDYVRRDDLERLVPVVKRQVRRAQVRKARREEEEAFEQSERKYRVLFDSAGDAIYISDFEGNILDANKIACVRYGYTRLELSRKKIADLDVEETAEAMAERMERIKRLGICIFERVHTTRNGLRIPVEVSARIIDFGGRKAVLSIVRDIRERKVSEEALRESEGRFRLLVENSLVGIGISSGDRVLFANQALLAIFGYDSLDAFTAVPIVDHAAPGSRDFIRDRLARLARGEPVSSVFEYEIVRRDGSIRTLAATSTQYVEGGLGVNQTIFEDVTERQRAEHALKESEERLSLARTAAGIGIYDYDASAGKIHWDDRMRGLWGIGPAVRVTYRLLKSGIHPDDRKAALASLLRALDPNGSGKYDAEFRVVNLRDGGVRWIAASGQVYFETGRVRRLVGMVQEVTERRRAEEALATSEMKYNRLFAEIADGCMLCRLIRDEAGRPADYVTLEVNAAFERIVGVGRDAAVGKRIRDLLPPEEMRSWIDIIAPVVAGGGSRVYEQYSPRQRKFFEGNVFSFEKDLFIVTFRDITERKRAEAALRESEERFRLIFQHSAAGLVIVGTDFRFLKVNPAFCRMLGYSEEELFAKTFQEVTLPEDRPIGTELASETLAGAREMFELEKRYVRKDGAVIWGMVISSLVRDHQGRPLHFVTQIQDITERKRAEETLRLRDAQLVNAMKVAELGDWEYDVASDTFTFNDNFFAIFGTTAEKVGGYTMRSREYADRFLHPDDRDLVRSETERALTTMEPHYSRIIEHRVIQEDGSIGFIAVRIFIVKDKSGKTIKTYGVNQNITRQKKAEEALRKISARNQAILSSVPDIIMETDQYKVYTWANQAGREFFGDDVIGREAAHYFEGDQDTYSKVEPLFMGGEDTVYVESWQRRRDGRKRLLAWWCRALKDESGAVTGTLSTAWDLTEKKMMEEFLQWELSLNTALAELSASLISPEATIADISRVVLDRALQLTLSANGFVALLDPRTGDCFIQSSDETQAGAAEAGLAFALIRSPDGRFEGLRGHALNTRTAFFTNEPKRHPAYTDPALGHVPLERFLAVPVTLGTELVGQIALANPDRDYVERDLDAVRRLAGTFALAVQSKRADERVRASLKEKTLLLKEIHHRIKNNLQVVMSLLNLQSFHLTDPKAKALFRENQLRIRSMSLVHERLYLSNDLSHVDFKEYITKLAVELFRAYRIDVNTIRLTVKADDVTLGIDASVPCGLIINELLLNSLKHAFPRERKGCISVSLERGGENRFLLTVADDGVGLAKNVDLYGSKSLGFSLVVALTEQLGGSIEVSRESGTKIEIAFLTKE